MSIVVSILVPAQVGIRLEITNRGQFSTLTKESKHMAETKSSGAMSKAKGRQHRKKAGYYTQQFTNTLVNKRRRAAKRTAKRAYWKAQKQASTQSSIA